MALAQPTCQHRMTRHFTRLSQKPPVADAERAMPAGSATAHTAVLRGETGATTGDGRSPVPWNV